MAERLRRPRVLGKSVRKELDGSIKLLPRHLKRLDSEIEQRTAKSDLRQLTSEPLESVPGVKKITSFVLIADLPELRKVSNRGVSSLTGLAPCVRQSGEWRGQAMISSGPGAARSAVYGDGRRVALEPCAEALLSTPASTWRSPQERVVHKSAGGMLTSIPEPVDLVGTAPSLTSNTVAQPALRAGLSRWGEALSGSFVARVLSSDVGINWNWDD